MPYTIKTQQIAVKDPDTGEYSGVDVLAEQTAEGLLNEIEAKGTTVKNEVDGYIAAARDDIDQLETDANTVVANAQAQVARANNEVDTLTASITSAIEDGVDRTLSRDGVPADAKLTGDAFSALDSNVRDVLIYTNPTLPYRGPGITVSRVDKSTYHFEGTIGTTSGALNFYMDSQPLPEWIVPGSTYCLSISGASNNNNNIYFQVLQNNGGTLTDLLYYKFSNGKYLFTVPSDFSGTVRIRAGWLKSNAGSQVNETITYHLYDAKTSGKEAINRASSALYYKEANMGQYDSCDDITDNCFVFISSNNNVKSIPDAPILGWLYTFYVSDNVRFQIIYPYETTDDVQIRQKNGSTWTSWRTISGA